MKILHFLHKMIGENKAISDNRVSIYNRENTKSAECWAGTAIKKLIWIYELTREELSNLIFAAVQLNSNVSLGGILESGLYRDFSDENGDTPLIWAVRIGNKEAAKLLLDHGADPFHKNKQGFDAICYSIKQPNILTLFEERYPMLNSLGNTIFTMYEQAVQAGNNNMSKTLLNLAVELKHETAIRISQAYKNNSQGDCSIGSGVNSLFKPST